MKWRRIIVGGLVCAAVAGVILWVLHARLVGHWLQVHTGTVNEAGPYYGFWSGFGSDIAEFGILGAIGTGLYQLVKKVNCHEPGCWRVGTHPAAGGQFMLCYRHHPDYMGKKPTHDGHGHVCASGHARTRRGQDLIRLGAWLAHPTSRAGGYRQAPLSVPVGLLMTAGPVIQGDRRLLCARVASEMPSRPSGTPPAGGSRRWRG
jgi:hypothetical protein